MHALVQIFQRGIELRIWLLRSLCSVPRVAPTATTTAHFKSVRDCFDKPLLILCVLMTLMMATCDFDLHPYSKGSCLQELQRVEQTGYTVRLIQDECGGPLTGTAVAVEQRMRLLPGLYVIKNVDYIDRAYEGRITVIEANEIHVQIPKGYGLPAGLERTYTLKRHVYF